NRRSPRERAAETGTLPAAARARRKFSHRAATSLESSSAFGRAALRNVDLRLLQPARIVDEDRLPLGELVERRGARLAVAVASVLDPAERHLDLRADRGSVHIDDPRLQLPHGFEGPVDVTRVDR